MGQWLVRFFAGATAVLAFGSPLCAEDRMALVIGNAGYNALPPLKSPAKDAEAFTEFLTSAGFRVTWGTDVSQNDMRGAIRAFSAAVAAKGPDTVALIYFSGYGLQVDGENFLLPVDARIATETDVPLEALRLTDVMNAIGATPSKARIFIVDASRANPYPQFKSASGRGLAPVEAPRATLVAFAAAPGTEAPEPSGDNSPFTAALIAVAKTPGLSIEEALKIVRPAVHGATEGRQIPWESSALGIGISLAPDAPNTGAPARRVQPLAYWREQLHARSATDAFEFVLSENAIDGYEEFLRAYPQSPFAAHVRNLVDRRREMMAWHKAVASNSVASYEAFLGRYSGSDFAPTARRLLERARGRSVAPVLPIASASTAAPVAAGATPEKKSEPAKQAVKRKPKVVRANGSEKASRQPGGTDSPPPARAPFSLSIGGVGVKF